MPQVACAPHRPTAGGRSNASPLRTSDGGCRQRNGTQQPNKSRQMKRWLRILLLALGMVITAQAQALAGSRTCSDGPDGRGDRKQAEWTIGKERSQAVLSNVNELVRLCSQAPRTFAILARLCARTPQCVTAPISFYTPKGTILPLPRPLRGADSSILWTCLRAIIMCIACGICFVDQVTLTHPQHPFSMAMST